VEQELETKPDEEGVVDVDEHDVAGPSPTPLSYYGTDFDVHGLVRRLDNSDVIIPTFDPAQPTESGLEGFQRKFVWRKPQMDRFVESLLLGYPVPGVFLVEEPNKRLLVLDGQQRLRTLLAFYRNSFRENPFRLENVDRDFSGVTYPALKEEARRTLDNTFIHATIVRHEDSAEGRQAVYQLFERLNTGGTNLQPQEIRVALFHGPFVDLLRELNDQDAWRRLYGPRSERLKDQELILRFFALLSRRGDYERPLKLFLNKFLEAVQGANAAQLERDSETFTRTCEVILESIGPSAFRLRRNLNAALIDAVMIGVADRIGKGPITELNEVTAAYSQLLADADFGSAISAATANEESVTTRLSKSIEAFSSVR
jgi:Protein of unknown function DUF262